MLKSFHRFSSGYCSGRWVGNSNRFTRLILATPPFCWLNVLVTAHLEGEALPLHPRPSLKCFPSSDRFSFRMASYLSSASFHQLSPVGGKMLNKSIHTGWCSQHRISQWERIFLGFSFSSDKTLCLKKKLKKFHFSLIWTGNRLPCFCFMPNM